MIYIYTITLLYLIFFAYFLLPYPPRLSQRSEPLSKFQSLILSPKSCLCIWWFSTANGLYHFLHPQVIPTIITNSKYNILDPLITGCWRSRLLREHYFSIKSYCNVHSCGVSCHFAALHVFDLCSAEEKTL